MNKFDEALVVLQGKTIDRASRAFIQAEVGSIYEGLVYKFTDGTEMVLSINDDGDFELGGDYYKFRVEEGEAGQMVVVDLAGNIKFDLHLGDDYDTTYGDWDEAELLSHVFSEYQGSLAAYGLL